MVTWSVLLLVSLTLTGCTERLITLTTLERALSVSNVNIHVASERAIRREGSITYLTPEILCSHMSFHVSFKYARRHKFFFTGDAFVRFFPCKKLKNNKSKLGFEKSTVQLENKNLSFLQWKRSLRPRPILVVKSHCIKETIYFYSADSPCLNRINRFPTKTHFP